MHPLEYRKAEASDMDYLLWLRKETMDEHLVKAGISLTQEEQIARINHLFDQANMILLNGEVIGLLKLDEKENEVEIVQVQIEPKFQGQGLGRQVIQSVIDHALNHDKRISLSVLQQNPAKDLYLKMGFKIVSEDESSFNMLYDSQTRIE